MRLSARYMWKRCSALMLSMLLAVEPVAFAQDEGSIPPPPPASAQTPAQPAFSQPELDQMLAPIALYPDPLLSQILMASTYPLEVVEAARWSRSNPSLRGDDAVRAVQQYNWDPSVTSLVAFPQLLQMMDEKLDWTERLGDAFLAQQPQVMDTVQNLRQKAYASGNLRSNDQMRVEPEGQIIAVEPANPEILYVPYYDPSMVYGSWWWSDYPPVYWAPWPGYYFDSGFAWGIGITITAGFFFGDCDWHHHRVNVVNVNNFYYNRMPRDDRHPVRNVNRAPGVWHHDPDHRRGVPYREPRLRQQYGRANASPETRREFRGYDQPVPGNRGVSGNRPTERVSPITVSPGRPDNKRGNQGGIPNARPTENRPDAGGSRANRSYEPGSRIYQGVPREVSRPQAESRPHALEDISRGKNVRDFSSRGRASSQGSTRIQRTAPAQRSSGSVGGGDRQHSR